MSGGAADDSLRLFFMKTKDQVTSEFKAELQALLDKWDAELSADDHYRGYPECGEDVRMTVTIPSIYEGATHVREWTEIDLGRIIFPRQGGGAWPRPVCPRSS